MNYKTSLKLLIASSSLAIFNVNAADVLVNNQIHQPASLNRPNHWILGTPNNRDNIFMTGYQSINIDRAIRLGTVNLYGFDGNDIEINDDCTINDIVNDISQNSQNIVTATNQNQPIANRGNNQAQSNIVFNRHNTKLTLRSNQLDSVRSIQLQNTTLEFESAITVDSLIYSVGAPVTGFITAKQDIIFNNKNWL